MSTPPPRTPRGRPLRLTDATLDEQTTAQAMQADVDLDWWTRRARQGGQASFATLLDAEPEDAE